MPGLSPAWAVTRRNNRQQGQCPWSGTYVFRSPIGVVVLGQATCKGGRLWLGPLQGQSQAARAACKGNRPRLGLPPAWAVTPGAIASKGRGPRSNAYGQKQRQLG
ncbi:hypothetical protein BHM03_00043463 [Ensete ventricosum]|nr:hypothetical protein BHM03_00043463 [Ensete ventricosum]